MTNEGIVIGGGASIKEGLALGLKDHIKNRFVIATNYSFLHFDNTFTSFIDKDFYCPSASAIAAGTYKDYTEELKKVSLIVGINKTFKSTDKILDNTILLKFTNIYNTDPIHKGFYLGEGSGGLTGIFAISLAEFLINYKGILYICGFDWNHRVENKVNRTTYTPYDKTTDTHYYSDSEIHHRGQHWLSFYERHQADGYFLKFIKNNLKIYNVSPLSNINCFEKINYEKMFELLSKEEINQEELRTEIKEKLKCIK